VQLYSPNPEHRARFAKQQRERAPQIEFVPVDSAESAVRGADVVVAATNSTEPVLEGRWIKPGAHVVSISGSDRLDQRREVDEETVTRSSLIVINSKVQVDLDQQMDLMPVLEAGRVSMDQIIELGELVQSGRPRVHKAEEITFHFNNTGMGIQFAAVGARMVEAAEARGVGTRWPYTWRGRSV